MLISASDRQIIKRLVRRNFSKDMAEKILENHNKYFFDFGSREITTLSNLIDYLFTWDRSPQGEDYWIDVFNENEGKELLIYKTIYDLT